MSFDNIDNDGPSKEEKKRAKAALLEETVQKEYDERERRESEKRHLLHEQRASQRQNIRARYELPERKTSMSKSLCCFK